MPGLPVCNSLPVLPQNKKDFRSVILAIPTRFAHAGQEGPIANDNIGGGYDRGGDRDGLREYR